MINKLIFDEQSVTDPQEIAEALNDHFCTIGERLWQITRLWEWVPEIYYI